MQTFEQWRNGNPITEMPIPADWDAAIFDDNVRFSTRLKYARARAHRLAKGSSRAAFIIPYEGRETVLKIAMNRAGVDQNNAEVELFNDWYIRNLNVTIPMIDHHHQDDLDKDIHWIHTEKASKLTSAHIKKFFGTPSLVRFFMVADPHGTYRRRHANNPEITKIENSPMFSPMQDLIGNYDGTIVATDLQHATNWGFYDNRPVIIDLGLTSTVYDDHYSSSDKRPKVPRF